MSTRQLPGSRSSAVQAAGDRSCSVGLALQQGQQRLVARSGINARREASILLAGVLELPPLELALHYRKTLDERQLAEYEARLDRRAAGEPLQYIEGRAAFRELTLRVDRTVLIPRPETEQLVESILQRLAGRIGLCALDLGTGSGAIAISLLVEGPFRAAVGVDISREALEVARYNAEEAGIIERIDLRHGSLFEPLKPDESFDVVVSNPPYIASDELGRLPEEVREWEPRVALFSGPTGLEILKRVIDGAPRHLRPGGWLALEVAPHLATDVVAHLRTRGEYTAPSLSRDLAGRWRIVMARRS